MRTSQPCSGEHIVACMMFDTVTADRVYHDKARPFRVHPGMMEWRWADFPLFLCSPLCSSATDEGQEAGHVVGVDVGANIGS